MDARQAIVAVFEAWERDDAAGVAALFADDGGYESPFFTETQVGRPAVRVLRHTSAGPLTRRRPQEAAQPLQHRVDP
jgi:ketosteroid isomerase-like protein